MAHPPPPPGTGRRRGPWGARPPGPASPAAPAPPPAAPPRAAGPLETHRFPCPTCGADLRYAPGPIALVCQHCGHQEAIPEARGTVPVLDLREAARLPDAMIEETRTVSCASCGAEIEFDPDLHAKECPFCASPIVTGTGTNRHIKPQAQLPFLLDEAEARAAMRRWLGRLWFAPNDLTRLVRSAEGLQGIYVPYWTYDADTVTDYQGQRGTVRHRPRQVAVRVGNKRQMRTEQVAEVTWAPARGRVTRRFADVLVLGSASLPKRFTDGIAPFDLMALTPYDPRFLAGFRAEAYTVPVETGYEEARAVMNAVIEGDVRRDIGGDQQRITRLSTEVGALGFRHVLLPVWAAAYRYRGQPYRFVINGRTGQTRGERPYSVVKIALTAALIAVLAAILAGLQLAG